MVRHLVPSSKQGLDRNVSKNFQWIKIFLNAARFEVLRRKLKEGSQSAAQEKIQKKTSRPYPQSTKAKKSKTRKKDLE